MYGFSARTAGRRLRARPRAGSRRARAREYTRCSTPSERGPRLAGVSPAPASRSPAQDRERLRARRPRSSRCRAAARDGHRPAASRARAADARFAPVAWRAIDATSSASPPAVLPASRRRAARARVRDPPGACSAISPDTSKPDVVARRGLAGDRLGQAVLAHQHDREVAAGSEPARTPARGATAARRPARRLALGIVLERDLDEHAASSRRLHELCDTAHASAASSPWRRNRSANGLPARMNGGSPSPPVRARLHRVVDAIEPRPRRAARSRRAARDPQEEVHLISAVAGTANRSTHINAERWRRSWIMSARWNGSNSSRARPDTPRATARRTR